MKKKFRLAIIFAALNFAGLCLAKSEVNKELPRKISFSIFDHESSEKLFDGVEYISWTGSQVTRKTEYFKGEENVQNEVVVYDFDSLVVSYYEVKNKLVDQQIIVKLTSGVYKIEEVKAGVKKSKQLKFKRGLYLGKVLHHLKLRNWSSLDKGAFVFNLVIPFQADFYAFQILKKERDNTYPNLDRIFLQPDSWLIRRFVDPISFYHDPETKRVMHYIGPSNVDEKGVESRTVRIDFKY